MKQTRSPISRCALILLGIAAAVPGSQETTPDEKQIKDLIATYATTIDRADTTMAETVFSNAPEVSFINPRGEDRGRQQIVTNLVQNLMGEFSRLESLHPRTLWFMFTETLPGRSLPGTSLQRFGRTAARFTLEGWRHRSIVVRMGNGGLCMFTTPVRL